MTTREPIGSVLRAVNPVGWMCAVLVTAGAAQPPAPTSIWQDIQYPSVTIPGTTREPLMFRVSSGGHTNRPQAEPSHLRLDVMWVAYDGVPLPKAIADARDIVVNLHTADGKVLTAPPQRNALPVCVTSGAGGATCSVIGMFPWSRNALDEGWFEVRVPGQTWWLELPYGFTRNPEDREVADRGRDLPHFPPGMLPLGVSDVLVPWLSVDYDFGRIFDGEGLSAKFSNGGETTASVALHRETTGEPGPDRGRQNLDTPRIGLRIEADGETLTGPGREIARRLSEDQHTRTDDFTSGADGLTGRTFGTVTVTVDGHRYEGRVPSSLFLLFQGRTDRENPHWLGTPPPLVRGNAGQADGDLQLVLGEPGKNTESLTATTSLLYLGVSLQNHTATPVSVDFDRATYDFEYEIDGTWYAFEPRPPIRTPLTAMLADPAYQALGLSMHVIAPGGSKAAYTTVPLAGRSPALQLHAVTPAGHGARFVPTPGPHTVRVRTGRTLEASRPAVESNAITVSFRTPVPIDTGSQSMVFTSSRGTALDGFRFVPGPADGQTIVRAVLERPPTPAGVAPLLTAAALQVDEPLAYYDLALPRRLGVPNPSLSAATSCLQIRLTCSPQYLYLARSGGQPLATVGIGADSAGSVLGWLANGYALVKGSSFSPGDSAANGESVFGALQRLATMTQVRGRNYEPRLLQIDGVRGTRPFVVVWLHSSSGGADLFYRPRDPAARGATKVEQDTLYSADDLLTAARVLPVSPRHDEAWAIATADACAKAPGTTYGGPLMPERAEVEIGLSDQQDRIVWYVFIPARQPDGQFSAPPPGAAFLVDEADGSCRRVLRQ